MTKFKNIFAVLFMFLQALSVFAAKKEYGIKVAVARVVNDSFTAPENEPSYKQTAVFKNLNQNPSLYSLQTTEFLLGEKVRGKVDEATGECYVSFEKLGGKIPLKYLEEKLFFSHPYCNLVTIMPLVTLEILKENEMTISMGTSLYSPDENETWKYYHYPANADELKGQEDENYIVMLTPERIGCIPKDNVCKIDDLRRLTIQQKRTNIIEQARKLLGQPYQWGGRAALEGHGYDCAALVQIAYLTGAGIDLPRADFEQANYGKEINPDDLASGDLLFTLWHRPMRNEDIMIIPIHVMIWVGGDMLIEASPISMTVREASVEDVFYGRSLNEIKNGQKFFANEKMRSVQFRRFL